MQSNQDRLISDLKKLKEYYKKHQKQSDITFDYIGFYVLHKLAIDLLGFSFEPFILLDKILHSISFTSVLLPLPLTPVTHMNLPNGNSTLIFFRLFSLAPLTTIYLLSIKKILS